MRHHVLLAVAGLAATGCVATPPPTVAPSNPTALPPECANFNLHPLRIWIDALVVRPGDTVPIRAGSVLNRHASIPPPPPVPVPTTCLADLRAAPADLAVVSADGASLTVSPDARPGTILTLEARSTVGPVQFETRIVGPDQAGLIGTWSQREVDCGGAPPPRRPVRELSFSPRGGFSVTWAPFETYSDYRGDFVHDVESGSLNLEVTSQNQRAPTPVMNAGIVLSEDGRRMVLTDLDLGDGQTRVPERRCRYVFGKL